MLARQSRAGISEPPAAGPDSESALPRISQALAGPGDPARISMRSCRRRRLSPLPPARASTVSPSVPAGANFLPPVPAPLALRPFVRRPGGRRPGGLRRIAAFGAGLRAFGLAGVAALHIHTDVCVCVRAHTHSISLAFGSISLLVVGSYWEATAANGGLSNNLKAAGPTRRGDSETARKRTGWAGESPNACRARCERPDSERAGSRSHEAVASSRFCSEAIGPELLSRPLAESETSLSYEAVGSYRTCGEAIGPGRF